jgi:hypothetical protein
MWTATELKKNDEAHEQETTIKLACDSRLIVNDEALDLR